MVWVLAHGRYPVVGIPPHGHHESMIRVFAAWARLALPAEPRALLNASVHPILEPMLGGEGIVSGADTATQRHGDTRTSQYQYQWTSRAGPPELDLPRHLERFNLSFS